jgi:MFS family permease
VPARSPLTLVAGLVVGACLTWNVSNVGAVADPLAATYGVSLAAVGLLTTALFVTHLFVLVPSGRGADRLGPRTIALLACAGTVAGCLLLLVDDSFALALLGRGFVGLGTGAGFIAGLDLVRAGGGGPGLQGLYGGATMAGGGLALMIVPPLTEATDWRAPYWSATVLALVAAVATLAAEELPRVGHRGGGVVRDPRLLPLGAVQAATFGLAVVAGNWTVPLLERRGAGTTAAGIAGGLVLFAGIVTRPGGGWLARRGAGVRLVAASLVGVTIGAVGLAIDGPLWLSTAAALVLGLGAGLPFATIFAATQRLRPDAPAAATAAVNGAAVLTILVGTPLAGLAFELPGDGAIAFAAVAAFSACVLVVLRRTPL